MRRHPVQNGRVVLLLLALVAVAVACGGGGSDDPAQPVIDDVVPEEAEAVVSITVRADGREAVAPDDVRRKASPLLAGRILDTPEPLASYGLDTPDVELVYDLADGPSRTVRIGSANFDRRGYYAVRDGDPRVFLVPADQLRPLLALVGR